MIRRFRTDGSLAAGILAAVAAAGGFAGAQDQPITFNKDIAPLIYRNCVSCHREGGTAPFSLFTFKDFEEHSKEIAAVVASGEMPPWLPDRTLIQFRHERKLEESEATLIGAWIESGMAEGEAGDLPPAPEYTRGWQLGEPDLILTLPDPVEMPAEGGELFRNFVIPGLPEESETAGYVRAIEFDPGSAGSILRATLREDSTGTGRRLDALDEPAGYAGLLGGNIPGSHVISWNPGQAPEPFRDGLGWRLSPGVDLILQLHLEPNGKPAPVHPRVGLYFSDQPPGAELKTIHLGAAGMAIPAGTKKYRVTDQIPLGLAVRVHSILPHAHRLATRFAAWATLPDGSKQPLILIPEWDHRWRQDYQFAKPLLLPAGSVIQMEAFYDNSSENPDQPGESPREVRWGPLSENEMADVWLTVTAEDPGEEERLRNTVYINDLRRQLSGYQTVLAGDPGNFEANSQIGHILVNLQKLREAIPFLNAALKSRPEDWLSWHNRGMARFFLGDIKGAGLNFRKALDLNPDYAPSHNGLSSAYSLTGELEESIPHFKRYLELRPEDSEIWTNYAVVLSKLGRLKEAEAEYRKILEQSPDQPGVLSNFGKLLARQGRIDEGLKFLDKAAKLDPGKLMIRYQAVEILLDAKRFEAARKAVEAILKIDPAQEAALSAMDEIEKAIKEAAAAPTEPAPKPKPPDR